jgi:hypothetical protein
MQSTSKPPRPWRLIAYEITHELNREKVLELAAELNQALSQQRVSNSLETPSDHKKSA